MRLELVRFSAMLEYLYVHSACLKAPLRPIHQFSSQNLLGVLDLFYRSLASSVHVAQFSSSAKHQGSGAPIQSEALQMGRVLPCSAKLTRGIRLFYRSLTSSVHFVPFISSAKHQGSGAPIQSEAL